MPETNLSAAKNIEALSTPVKDQRSWPKLPELLERAVILYVLERVNSSTVRMSGKTNLPHQTRLSTQLAPREPHRQKDERWRIAEVEVDGTFSAVYEDIQDGIYVINVQTVAIQLPAIREILGEYGENIRGPLREPYDDTSFFIARRLADATIDNGEIAVGYRQPNTAHDLQISPLPTAREWAEWASDLHLDEKKRIYSRISGAWAAADEEARKKGLLLKREQLSITTVNMDQLDMIEQEIEKIEDRKFRELAQELGISIHYLRAINRKGGNEGW